MCIVGNRNVGIELQKGIPAGARHFSFSPKGPDRFWGPRRIFNGYRGFCLEVKRPGREAEHSNLVSNLRMNTAIPLRPVCLHGAEQLQLYILPSTTMKIGA